MNSLDTRPRFNQLYSLMETLTRLSIDAPNFNSYHSFACSELSFKAQSRNLYHQSRSPKLWLNFWCVLHRTNLIYYYHFNLPRFLFFHFLISFGIVRSVFLSLFFFFFCSYPTSHILRVLCYRVVISSRNIRREIFYRVTLYLLLLITFSEDGSLSPFFLLIFLSRFKIKVKILYIYDESHSSPITL